MQMIDKVCFFVGGNCVINEDADVCDAGYEHCSPGHAYGPSIRDYVLIHIVKSGKGIFCAENTTYHLSKNKAFVIRPDTLHSYTADTSDPWHYLWVGFRGKGAGALCEKAFGQTECVFDVDADLAFELERILIEKDDEIKTIFSLTGFIYRLLGSIYARRHPAPARPDIVRSALRFIENNYFRPFSIAWLANELGMSRAHFTTVFSAAMNVSPYLYLTGYRISKAQKLLLEQRELSVTDIAFAVGFSSVERFSEMFKKYTGLSPLRYRRTAAAEEFSLAARQ